MRHGDGLNRDPATGRNQPVESLKVRGPEPVSDRLDHLDRQHGVVVAVDIAVVAQFDLDSVGQARFGHPLPGQSLLLGRQSDRTDVCASRRGADAQFAPAGTDLEHSAARPDARGVEEPVDLAALRVGEVRLVGGQAARTAHWSTSWSRRGTRRTGRWTGRSARRCCAAPALRLLCCDRGWRTTARGRNRCRTGGISSVNRLPNSVSRPAISVELQSPAMYDSPKPMSP